jgi:hypothetical protein
MLAKENSVCETISIERVREGIKTHRLRPTQRLLRGFDAGFPVDAHATDRLEALVRQHKDSAVVRLEVVDLLAEEQRPEVFADEFDVV